jgi:hypothetical protein
VTQSEKGRHFLKTKFEGFSHFLGLRSNKAGTGEKSGFLLNEALNFPSIFPDEIILKPISVLGLLERKVA